MALREFMLVRMKVEPLKSQVTQCHWRLLFDNCQLSRRCLFPQKTFSRPISNNIANPIPTKDQIDINYLIPKITSIPDPSIAKIMQDQSNKNPRA